MEGEMDEQQPQQPIVVQVYSPPVNRLLTFGDPREEPEWPDFPALGFGPEHVPELIRMATDEALHDGDPASLEVWAPIHAWRALGQLRAEEAIDPLLGLFARLAGEWGDEWVGSDLPAAYGHIGPAAIPALAAYLAEPAHGLYPRMAAAEGLEFIGTRHSEARDAAIAPLVRALDASAGVPDPDDDDILALNGSLISNLIALKAVEAAPSIERAFADDRVDEMIAGDWEDVQVALEMREPDPNKPAQLLIAGRITPDELLERAMAQPAPNPFIDPFLADPLLAAPDDGLDAPDSDWDAPAPVHRPGELAQIQRSEAARKEKAKAKNKMAQQSRRKNRGKGKKRK